MEMMKYLLVVKILLFLKVNLASDTIRDFEVNNDKVILEVNENDSITLEGIDTNLSKLRNKYSR